jgi:rubrerythrin
MDKRYRTRYHMSIIGNLEEIRDQGIRKFVTNERERWTCRTCGGVMDVHHGRCASCGKEREASGCDKEE